MISYIHTLSKDLKKNLRNKKDMSRANLSITTIIVAGGSGNRMGSETPKQFLLLGGLPVLMRTMETMWSCVSNYVDNVNCNIVVVLPEAQINYWKELCENYNFNIPHKIAIGGGNRFESVRSGLREVQEADIVLVHDGVRPLPSKRVVADVISGACESGAAIPVVEVLDSLRKIVNNLLIAVDRSKYRAVQTPQAFRKDIIFEAYKQPYHESFTDDASVVEKAGYDVKLTEGNPENIKITTPSDLMLAEMLIDGKDNQNKA